MRWLGLLADERKTRVNKCCGARVMIDKEYFITFFVFHFPADWKCLRRIAKHVEEFNELFVVLIFFVVG